MNATEKFVTNFYESIKVDDPLFLSIDFITEMLNIQLVYWNHTSAIANYYNKYTVFINDSINEYQQWQEFGHEMYHYFYDETNYHLLHENYAEYGETKADYFAYHFCVPTFMLVKLQELNVYEIMNLFNVEYAFALRRLEMHKNNIIQI